MANEEALKSLMFTLSYMLMKRRRDINSAETQRRREVQRRVRHRQYFLQRQRRMLMMLIAQGTRPVTVARTRAWSNTPSTDWWERVVLTEFQPSDWLERFRMSKETFFHICNKLKPWLARQDTCLRPALPLEKRVALVLWRLASNVEYRTIGELFGVGRSTVCKCVREVCHAIGATLRPLYLREPSEQELEDAARLFSTRWGFPHCVGAVSSLHVPIIAPSADADSYWNSRGWHSVITQGTVNGLGQFWDVCAGFPGGSEPASILQNSSLWTLGCEGRLLPQSLPRNFMGKQLGSVILGDAGYPLQTWLLKAYDKSHNLTAGQRAFNRRLERARAIVDEAFLRLRARWQCLLKRNDCHVDGVPAMIVACCVLHNMCEVHGDELAEEWLEAARREESPMPTHMVPVLDDDPAGEEVRELFCQYFLQQEHQQNQQEQQD
ncbi:uncharacterized protein LOC108280525 [Ictalurus punctatus]|uniref:Putative nuclease HARBI1 n=1 Tax=Ictalurus punctatus TaxID=7998 RepID=W5UI35_ICTPU|nr:uncharacterized protein LOC108280525 [Ictalurus punctatus]XP_053508208.1 uncharacterized protein LOC128624517 [Ictalurus furcatus]